MGAGSAVQAAAGKDAHLLQSESGFGIVVIDKIHRDYANTLSHILSARQPYGNILKAVKEALSQLLEEALSLGISKDDIINFVQQSKNA